MQKAVGARTPEPNPSFAAELSDSSSGLLAGITALSSLLIQSPNPEIGSSLSSALKRMKQAAAYLEGATTQLAAKADEPSPTAVQAAEVVKWYSLTPQRIARFSEAVSYFNDLPMSSAVSAADAGEKLSWIAAMEPRLREDEAERYLRNAAKVGVLMCSNDDQGPRKYALTEQAREWIKRGSFTELYGIPGSPIVEQGS